MKTECIKIKTGIVYVIVRSEILIPQYFPWYVLGASMMMTPWGRNMWLSELFYTVVLDVYLLIPYFIVQHSGMHDF
jgi:hypothetical protein